MRNQRLKAPQESHQLEPGGSGLDSSAHRLGVRVWPGTPGPVNVVGREAAVKVCGVIAAMLQGHSWTPIPSSGSKVNVGSIPVVPAGAVAGSLGGKARRRLTRPGWDGGPVVVRDRESRSHGEGGQRDRSIRHRQEHAGEHRRTVARRPWGVGAGTGDADEAAPLAAADPGRRFDDLHNLVYDPAFLVAAWSRVRGQHGCTHRWCRRPRSAKCCRPGGRGTQARVALPA